MLQSRSTAIHVEDIAYTLSEDRLLHPEQDQTDVSYYIVGYCGFGYGLAITFMLHVKASKKHNMKLLISVSNTIWDHIDIVKSAVFVGYLVIICEFITTTVYFRSRLTVVFHLLLWFPSLLGFLAILYKVMHICYYKKYKSDGLNLLIGIFAMGIAMFLFYIYCYALPTFLLLLVYPTKIITVVAYLITFMFITSIVSFISIRPIIAYYHKATIGRFMMFVSAVSIFAYPFLIFAIVIQFLYVLVLGEASAISTGPYTVLSLIPTAAISAAGWLIKNKVFSSVSEEEDNNNHNKENEESAIKDDEALTLKLLVNEDTPDKKVKSYGATVNDD